MESVEKKSAMLGKNLETRKDLVTDLIKKIVSNEIV